MAVNKERRVDALSRSEFMETMDRFEAKMDLLSEYQRTANGKIATAYEKLATLEERTLASSLAAQKLATLEERTQNMRDGPGRLISYASMAIAVLTLIMSLIKSGVRL